MEIYQQIASQSNSHHYQKSSLLCVLAVYSDSDPADIIQSHTSIGFDRTTSYRDINITFPVDRLEELVQSGYIGELSDNYYSYMGAINDVTGLIEDSGPEVATKLLAEDVDVVLLVPT